MTQTRAIISGSFFLWGATMAAAVQGEVVLFDNTAATFTWLANGGSQPGGAFDPTRAPGDQANFAPARRLGYSAFQGGPSGDDVAADFILAPSPAGSIRIARSTTPVIIPGPNPGQETSFLPAAAFTVGQTVGADHSYSSRLVDVGYFAAALGRGNLLGDSAFVGFRVTLDDGLPHYGWIEINYRLGPVRFDQPSTIFMYQPVRWAYETLPNTPITVPSPGALGLLGLAAMAAARRHRGQA